MNNNPKPGHKAQNDKSKSKSTTGGKGGQQMQDPGKLNGSGAQMQQGDGHKPGHGASKQADAGH